LTATYVELPALLILRPFQKAAFSAARSITSERAKGFNHQPKILPQVKPCLGMAL